MKIKDGCVIVYKYPNGHPYRVELERCNTPTKMLGWVAHLSEKSWMDSRSIHEMVELISGHFGWEIHAF